MRARSRPHWRGCAPTPPIDDVNLMPALLDAARSYATLGEIVDALADVFGRWVEEPRF